MTVTGKIQKYLMRKSMMDRLSQDTWQELMVVGFFAPFYRSILFSGTN